MSAAALSVLAGCPSRDVSAVDPNQAKEGKTLIPVSVNRNIDILFVVDDSGSMRHEQESLARNFPEFIRVLESIEGGLPNVHLGVISSNVGTGPDGTGGAQCNGNGDNGKLLTGAADTVNDTDSAPCPALTDGSPFIRDILDPDTMQRQFNYSGNLADQFSCMAQLGTDGCGFEQHLEAVKRALTNNTDNAGFLRDDAFLAVIFIQDEDDCSATDNSVFADQGAQGSTDDTRDSPLGEISSFRCFEFGTVCEPADERTLGPRQNCVSDESSQYIAKVSGYIDFLKGVKDDPSKVIVAAITGGTDPVTVGIDPQRDQLWVEPQCVVCPGGGSDCDVSFGSEGGAIVAAAPAIRMRAFLDAFPQRSTYQSICNYDPAIDDVNLSGALTQIAILLKQVIGSPCIEGNLAEPYECEVSDVQNINTDSQTEIRIPSCEASGGSTPCWRLVPDDQCTTETGLKLEIDRGGDDPPPDTTVVARCLIE